MKMKQHKTSLVCATIIIFAISILNYSHSTEAAGFSIDLIHRDSLQSPNSLPPSFDQIEASLQRSFNRAKTLIQDYSQQSSASADIVNLDKGEYLLRFALGTPKVETLAVADTGSDLTWIQCKPCRPWRCFKQRAPLFAPNRSSTYTPIPCGSLCKAIPSTNCYGTKGSCGYELRYGDNSFSQGDVALETITLGKNFSIPQVVIGCSHSSGGTFSPATSGIVGLGGGKQSLIRRMGPLIKGRFSYCLVQNLGKRMKTSKMHFGDKAVVSGATTPIVAKSPDTFYYLTLEAMSVGNERFNLGSSSTTAGEGNIVIDSGSTLTFLPKELYDQVEGAVRRQVNLRKINGRPKQQLKLCYLLAMGDADERKLPEMTVHFKGVDVKLKSYNTFIRTSRKSICLAFAPSFLLPIYGNLAQINFLIGYDLIKKTVSFKPTDCSKA